MPQVSRRKLDDKVEKELLESLEYIFIHSNPGEIRKILPALMTKTERLMVAKRLGIAILVNEEMPPSAIDEVLKVTQATITKMRILMQARAVGFDLALKKIGRRQTEKSLKKLLLKLALYAVSAAGGRLPRQYRPF